MMFSYQPKIEDFADGAPWEMFAAVTTRDEYTVTFHETLSEAQQAAVSAAGGEESAFWVEGENIVMDSRACPDYGCAAGRVSEMLKSEIDGMTTSDIAGLAAVLKSWSDAFQATMAA